MGIHSGPISGVVDVNERANVAGAGINLAQRVMNCGDAGHILLSHHVAEDLAEYERWRPFLHDIGTFEVKHGARVSVTNLYSDEVGNPNLPGKLQAVKKHHAQVRWAAVGIALLVVVALAAALLSFLRKGPARSLATAMEKSIAVLPFENLSEEKGNAYFAEGIKDEILTKLATVRDLKVISRTSTAKYQSKPDNLKTVAQELGVSTVLEGAVQKAGDKVRVNVQLIDARSDTHLWAKSYDRDLKDVLAVESEVSQQIADALQANLSPSESHALASAGTRDAEAYDLFLKGEYEFHQADTSLVADDYDRAATFYRQALARDPNFVEAAAKLAESRLSRHYHVSPLTATELEEMKSIIDHALALAPNSPEAHFALNMFFYYGHRQWDNALTELNRTLELQPNNAAAREGCAAVYRRRGEWERSLRDFERAQELDPRAAETPAELGSAYAALRMWKEAERAELRALSIDPHTWWAAISLLVNRLNATGDADFARRALDGFPEANQWLTAFAGRGSRAFGDVTHIIGVPIYLDVIQRRFTDAFEAIDKQVPNTDMGRRHQLAGRVILRLLAGERDAAKSAAEEALPPFEARLRERPDAYFAMMELSWVYLALERNADALRLSRQAAELIPIEKDALLGPVLQALLAQIEARAGAPEEAIKRLRHLLSIPAGHVISIARLKVDPVWDPIRDRPDFQQLLLGPEQVGPNK
jgi:TolB-like protein/Tfp pilus assembly protein PilF